MEKWINRAPEQENLTRFFDENSCPHLELLVMDPATGGATETFAHPVLKDLEFGTASLAETHVLQVPLHEIVGVSRDP